MKVILTMFAFFLGAIPAPSFARNYPSLPLEAYGDLPAVEDMTLSPDGTLIAAATRVKGQRIVAVFDQEGKAKTSIPLKDVKLRRLEWAGDNFLILFTSTTENLGPDFVKSRMELMKAIIVNVGNPASDLAFARSPDIANIVTGNYGVRLIDGQWYGFFGSIKLKHSAIHQEFFFENGGTTLFQLDLSTNKAKTVENAADQGHWRDWLVDGQGKIGATLEFTEATGAWSISNAKGETIARGSEPSGSIDLLFFGSDGSSAIYSVKDDKLNDFRWFEVPLSGGPAKEILSGNDIGKTFVDPRNNRFLGYREHGADGKIVLFDPAKQAILAKVYRAFPNLTVDIRDWTPDFSHILVEVSGNAESGTWYTVDLAKGRANPVGYDRPSILSRYVGPISKVTYTASDGLEMDGILTLPPFRKAEKLPVVMLPHGGPYGLWDIVQFDWLAQAFASRGYAVFQPNFRGSGGRGLAFEKAGYGQWGRKMQSDISDGLAALAAKGIVDPERACIVGASYGGYAALAGVTLQQGIYRCAVAIAPVSDVNELYRMDYRNTGDNNLFRRNQREIFGDPSRFSEISPRRHAAQASAPILIIHGTDDTRLPLEQSTRMADALKDAGKPYRLVIMKDEDHWLSSSDTRNQALDEAMKFVTQYDPPD